MKIDLDVIASATIKRKKPWRSVIWFGKTKESLLLCDGHRLSLLFLPSGQTKRSIPPISHLLNDITQCSVTKDGAYLLGLLVTQQIFIWHKDSDTVSTISGLEDTLSRHDPDNIKIFSLGGCDRLLIVCGCREFYVWEKDRRSSGVSEWVGTWSAIHADRSSNVPPSGNREATVDATFCDLNGEICCQSSVVSTQAQNVHISTLYIQFSINDRSPVVCWSHLDYSPLSTDACWAALSSPGCYIASYSHNGDILAIALNQKVAHSSRIVYVSPRTASIVVTNLKLGDTSDKKSGTSRWVSSIAWTSNDLFLIATTNRGTFFALSRLGEPIALQTSGCSMDLGPSRYLPLHPRVQLTQSHGDANESAQQKFSVSTHPRLPIMLCSDGFMVTVLQLPVAMTTLSLMRSFTYDSCRYVQYVREQGRLQTSLAEAYRVSTHRREWQTSQEVHAAETKERIKKSVLSQLHTTDMNSTSTSQLSDGPIGVIQGRNSGKIEFYGDSAENETSAETSFAKTATSLRKYLAKAESLLFACWSLAVSSDEQWTAETDDAVNHAGQCLYKLLRCKREIGDAAGDEIAVVLKRLVYLMTFEHHGAHLLPAVVQLTQKVAKMVLSDAPSTIGGLQSCCALVSDVSEGLVAAYTRNALDWMRDRHEERDIRRSMVPCWKVLYKSLLDYHKSLKMKKINNPEMEVSRRLLADLQNKLVQSGCRVHKSKETGKKHGDNSLPLLSAEPHRTEPQRRSTQQLRGNDEDRRMHSVLYSHIQKNELDRAVDFVDSLIISETYQNSPTQQSPCIVNASVRRVVQSMARFMARFFTHMPLFIYPTHNAHPLPPAHLNPDLSDKHIIPCYQHEIVVRVGELGLDNVWSCDRTLEYLLLCGCVSEGTWFANAVGDWRAALTLSVACSQHQRIAKQLYHSENQENQLTEDIQPQRILQRALTTVETAGQAISSTEDQIIMISSLKHMLQAAVMANVDIVPWLLDNLVTRLKHVSSLLSPLVPSQFYLPAPPIYCPQSAPRKDSVEQSNDKTREETTRYEASCITQVILSVLQASNLTLPLASAFAKAIGLVQQKASQFKVTTEGPCDELPADLERFAQLPSCLQAHTKNRAVSLVLGSFRDLCSLLWMFHTRDELCQLLRRRETFSHKMDGSHDTAWLAHSHTVLSHAVHMVAFTRFLSDESSIFKVILSVAAELPPTEHTADILAEYFHQTDRMNPDVLQKLAALLHDWRSVTIKPEDDGKSARVSFDSMRASGESLEDAANNSLRKSVTFLQASPRGIGLSVYFDKQCLGVSRQIKKRCKCYGAFDEFVFTSDTDEMSSQPGLILIGSRPFETKSSFADFLNMFYVVCFTKLMDSPQSADPYIGPFRSDFKKTELDGLTDDVSFAYNDISVFSSSHRIHQSVATPRDVKISNHQWLLKAGGLFNANQSNNAISGVHQSSSQEVLQCQLSAAEIRNKVIQISFGEKYTQLRKLLSWFTRWREKASSGHFLGDGSLMNKTKIKLAVPTALVILALKHNEDLYHERIETEYTSVILSDMPRDSGVRDNEARGKQTHHISKDGVKYPSQQISEQVDNDEMQLKTAYQDVLEQDPKQMFDVTSSASTNSNDADSTRSGIASLGDKNTSNRGSVPSFIASSSSRRDVENATLRRATRNDRRRRTKEGDSPRGRHSADRHHQTWLDGDLSRSFLSLYTDRNLDNDPSDTSLGLSGSRRHGVHDHETDSSTREGHDGSNSPNNPDINDLSDRLRRIMHQEFNNFFQHQNASLVGDGRKGRGKHSTHVDRTMTKDELLPVQSSQTQLLLQSVLKELHELKVDSRRAGQPAQTIEQSDRREKRHQASSVGEKPDQPRNSPFIQGSGVFQPSTFLLRPQTEPYTRFPRIPLLAWQNTPNSPVNHLTNLPMPLLGMPPAFAPQVPLASYTQFGHLPQIAFQQQTPAFVTPSPHVPFFSAVQSPLLCPPASPRPAPNLLHLPQTTQRLSQYGAPSTYGQLVPPQFFIMPDVDAQERARQAHLLQHKKVQEFYGQNLLKVTPWHTRQRKKKPRRVVHSEEEKVSETQSDEVVSQKSKKPEEEIKSIQTAREERKQPPEEKAKQTPLLEDIKQEDELVVNDASTETDAQKHDGFIIPLGTFDEYLPPPRGMVSTEVDSYVTNLQYEAAMAMKAQLEKERRPIMVDATVSAVETRDASVGTDLPAPSLRHGESEKPEGGSAVLPPDLFLNLEFVDAVTSSTTKQIATPPPPPPPQGYLNVMDVDAAKILSDLSTQQPVTRDKTRHPHLIDDFLSMSEVISAQPPVPRRSTSPERPLAVTSGQHRVLPHVTPHTTDDLEKVISELKSAGDKVTMDMFKNKQRQGSTPGDTAAREIQGVMAQREQHARAKTDAADQLRMMGQQMDTLDIMRSSMERDLNHSREMLERVESLTHTQSLDRASQLEWVEASMDSYIPTVRDRSAEGVRSTVPTPATRPKGSSNDAPLEIYKAHSVADSFMSGMSGISDIIGELLMKGGIDGKMAGLTPAETDQLTSVAKKRSIEQKTVEQSVGKLGQMADDSRINIHVPPERKALHKWMYKKRAEQAEEYKQKRSELREMENIVKWQKKKDALRKVMAMDHRHQRFVEASTLISDMISDRSPVPVTTSSIPATPQTKRSHTKQPTTPAGKRSVGGSLKASVVKRAGVPGSRGRGRRVSLGSTGGRSSVVSGMTTTRASSVPSVRTIQRQSSRGGKSDNDKFDNNEITSVSQEMLTPSSAPQMSNVDGESGVHAMDTIQEGGTTDTSRSGDAARRTKTLDNKPFQAPPYTDLVRTQRPEITRARPQLDDVSTDDDVVESADSDKRQLYLGKTIPGAEVMQPTAAKTVAAAATRSSSLNRPAVTYTQRLKEMKKGRTYSTPIIPASTRPVGICNTSPGKQLIPRSAKKDAAHPPQTYTQQLQSVAGVARVHKAVKKVFVRPQVGIKARGPPHKPQTYTEQLQQLNPHPSRQRKHTSPGKQMTGRKRSNRTRPYDDPYEVSGNDDEIPDFPHEWEANSVLSSWSVDEDIQRMIYAGDDPQPVQLPIHRSPSLRSDYYDTVMTGGETATGMIPAGDGSDDSESYIDWDVIDSITATA